MKYYEEEWVPLSYDAMLRPVVSDQPTPVDDATWAVNKALYR